MAPKRKTRAAEPSEGGDTSVSPVRSRRSTRASTGAATSTSTAPTRATSTRATSDDRDHDEDNLDNPGDKITVRRRASTRVATKEDAELDRLKSLKAHLKAAQQVRSLSSLDLIYAANMHPLLCPSFPQLRPSASHSVTVTVLYEIAEALLRQGTVEATKLWINLADRAGEPIDKKKAKELMTKVEKHMQW